MQQLINQKKAGRGGGVPCPLPFFPTISMAYVCSSPSCTSFLPLLFLFLFSGSPLHSLSATNLPSPRPKFSALLFPTYSNLSINKHLHSLPQILLQLHTNITTIITHTSIPSIPRKSKPPILAINKSNYCSCSQTMFICRFGSSP